MSPPDDSRLRAALTAVGVTAGYLLPSVTAGVAFVRPWVGVRDRQRSGRGVVLTFDDGPHLEGTPAVLELLRERNALATFFLVGEQVAARPALAAEIHAAGHEIAIHCQRHRSLLRLAPWQVRDDLTRAHSAIVEATGVEPRLYRPPYGVLNAAALVVARRRGWTPLLWTREGHDWEAKATAETITSRLTRKLQDGDVLLLHDADYYSAPGSWRNTVAALPLVFEQLDRNGLELTFLD